MLFRSQSVRPVMDYFGRAASRKSSATTAAVQCVVEMLEERQLLSVSPVHCKPSYHPPVHCTPVVSTTTVVKAPTCGCKPAPPKDSCEPKSTKKHEGKPAKKHEGKPAKKHDDDCKPVDEDPCAPPERDPCEPPPVLCHPPVEKDPCQPPTWDGPVVQPAGETTDPGSPFCNEPCAPKPTCGDEPTAQLVQHGGGDGCCFSQQPVCEQPPVVVVV